jgi:hypothetical protein
MWKRLARVHWPFILGVWILAAVLPLAAGAVLAAFGGALGCKTALSWPDRPVIETVLLSFLYFAGPGLVTLAWLLARRRAAGADLASRG